MYSLRARWIVPISSPPIDGGYLHIIDRKIRECSQTAYGPSIDLGEVAVVPGFINAHVHLDLEPLEAGNEPIPSMSGWLRQVVAARIASSQRPDALQHQRSVILHNLSKVLSSGAAVLGDIAASPIDYNDLETTAIGAVLFREVIGHKPTRFEPLWNNAIEIIRRGHWYPWQLGISPHAPFSTSAEIYQRINELSRGDGYYHVATHWFESQEERDFLRGIDGPMSAFLHAIGAIEEQAPFVLDDPWTLLESPNADAPRWILVHANIMEPDDFERLAGPIRDRIAGVVYCPRTHARFGHPPHPWREFRRLGIPVGLGTDSLASNPDLDIYEEARFLAATQADADPRDLFKMLTLDGAKTLGVDLCSGSFANWQSHEGIQADADLVVIRSPALSQASGSPRLEECLLAPEAEIVGIMRGGKWAKEPPGITPI